MLAKTQVAWLAKTMGILAIVLLVGIVIIGCGLSPKTSDQNNDHQNGNAQIGHEPLERNGKYEQQPDELEQKERQNQDQQEQEQQEQEQGQADAKIIIRSENQITISSEEVLEQLNKEIEQLLKSLDSMDTISDEQLDF